VDDFFSKQIALVVVVLGTLVLIEFLAFGWPQTYLEFIYNLPDNVLRGVAATKESAVLVMFNAATPVIYLVVKLMSFFLVLNIYRTQRKYMIERDVFETMR
jgi:hypothetical protein